MAFSYNHLLEGMEQHLANLPQLAKGNKVIWFDRSITTEPYFGVVKEVAGDTCLVQEYRHKNDRLILAEKAFHSRFELDKVDEFPPNAKARKQLSASAESWVRDKVLGTTRQ